MRFKRALAVATAGALVAAGGIASVALTAGPARAATITTVGLPFSTYSQMLVDPVHQHLFITSGPGSSSILVTDYSGQTVATIPGEPGATGLALSSDGSTVYAALANGDAVSAISTGTLTETARYATGAGTDPAYVAYTSGKIWFSYVDGSSGAIGSIDPGTSPATVTLNATNAAPGNWYGAPELTASPAGDLVAGETGAAEPLNLASYDVSSGTATTLTPETYFGNYQGLSGLQITPDGKDVVAATATSAPIFQVSDLSAAGEYPASGEGVSIASNGTVATVAESGTNWDALLFAPGGSTPLDTYSFGDKSLLGVALSPDASELFTVGIYSISVAPPGIVTRHLVLNIVNDPGPVQGPSTVSLAGPATVKHGQPLTLTGSLGGATPYTGGQVLQVTRTDSAEPDGVALPDVTTAADGSFTITDTPPKLHANKGTVTYQVSYAGDAYLTASSATVSVAVTAGNG